ELQFAATGGPGAVPELELWQDAEAAPARPLDPAARELPPGFASFSGDPTSDQLTRADCTGFLVDIARSPPVFRRAHLIYDARGLFRSFAVTRSINGMGEHGGQWLPSDGEPRTIVDEIDPALLIRGSNAVTLCSPDAATGDVAISNLRIVGELDTGVEAAS